MAQTYEEEAEREIEVTSTRPEKLQQESKDNQSFVLVNPPTLSSIFNDFDMEVEEKERSKTFCTADTFVLDDLESVDSYVLEIPDKLPFLNKGVSVSLSNDRGEMDRGMRHDDCQPNRSVMGWTEGHSGHFPYLNRLSFFINREDEEKNRAERESEQRREDERTVSA
ncbi:hypothetical protein Sjap_020301 [Stephania japonica]|uniref:Uncharacterized protein n=1 Tax=Stephania japonica TaxID=461633 RepID=A0AAP0HYW2_9MAGN